jgi:hypothetical protein
MKTATLLASLVLAVSSITAQGADLIPSMRVESSRAMKLAVVNADESNPANTRLHKAFAESLGFQISQRYNSPIPLKPMVVDAQVAAEGLANGTYDLVAVIGTHVPASLRGSAFKSLKAVPTNGEQKPAINLIAAEDDRTLAAMIDEAFPQALNESFFQLAFASYRKSGINLERTDWNVASLH